MEDKKRNVKGPGKGGLPPTQKKNGKNMQDRFVWLLVVLGLFLVFQWVFSSLEETATVLTYKELFQAVEANRGNETILSAVKSDDRVLGTLSNGKRFTANVPLDDPELLKLMRMNIPKFDVKPPQTFLSNLFYSLGPMIIFIFFLWFFIYRGASAGGGKMMSFGKSRAKLATKDREKVTFDDVAGIEEAKEELKEVIDFLKDPSKFQKLGGKMPKGVLLMGPPGTGKTLLAKAVSGEAGVPFFSLSGSDFVEMFVGVGASRVRDLFEQAKKSVKLSKKGCIIFIDEIDAVGRQRFSGIGGGHDEREQTLNALLAEMDGFDTATGVILVAATNRPDVLDPALLRPGRFDRQVVVARPDIVGRKAIMDVHSRKVKMAKDVELGKIAKQTTGFSGADLANLINEAALLGARRDKKSVGKEELQEAMERVIMGPERKSRKKSEEDKKITAYHESGHALMAYFVEEVDPMHKVTIISRGFSGGSTIFLPEKDSDHETKSKLIGNVITFLAGRASEEIVFKDVSTGAQDDLKRATELARAMVTQYGMSEKLGPRTFGKRHDQVFLGRDISEERDYSEETAKAIDEEVSNIMDGCYNRAKALLLKNRDKLDLLAGRLMEKETLYENEVSEMLGYPPRKTEEDAPEEPEAKSKPKDKGQAEGEETGEEDAAA